MGQSMFRGFRSTGCFILLTAFLSIPPFFCCGAPILSVDYRSIISQGDLHYETPVVRSDDGLPVGNGTMGSLVWTEPAALKFQINRVDVYASNCETTSFNARDWDYAWACGYVDIDFVDFGKDVFDEEKTVQHLGIYDGLAAVEGNGVRAQVLAWHKRDVMAVHVEDSRKKPQCIKANLRMIRHLATSFPGQSTEYANRKTSVVKTKHHTATSKLHVRQTSAGKCIVLTQVFEEGGYYCGSAVAVGIAGRNSKAMIAEVTEARLAAEPGAGAFTILITSAASFDRGRDIIGEALAALEEAAQAGFDKLLQDNKAWWHNFWSKSYVRLHSADGDADFVQAHYAYYLYLMASSSRGRLAPNFGSMLWSTGGDYSTWGAQQWWGNLRCIYYALFEANHIELIDPMFAMYSGMYEACATAARQQWGADGIYIPETAFFDGLAKLPEDIAAEMRDLYLLCKPWSGMSDRFRRFADVRHPHSSRWNWKSDGRWIDGQWVYRDRMDGPYGCVVHLFASTAEVAYFYWLRYEHTQDTEWLRKRAYPMIKGAAQFYRTYPGVQKGTDGLYHITNVNNYETYDPGQTGNRTDTPREISAMRGILPIAIKASEMLGIDSDLREDWKELLDNLVPLKDWRHGPTISFDHYTAETGDPARSAFADRVFYPGGLPEDEEVAGLSGLPIFAAIYGRADLFGKAVVSQLRGEILNKRSCRFNEIGRVGVLRNRMDLSEGVNCVSAERLGLAAHGLQLALCQSVPPGPAGAPVIRLFEAWPGKWDAAFKLLCRGAFVVSSSIRNGTVEFVEIEPQRGGVCRLRNPWPAQRPVLYRDGEKAQMPEGDLLELQTRAGQKLLIVPEGCTPEKLKRVVNAGTER